MLQAYSGWCEYTHKRSDPNYPRLFRVPPKQSTEPARNEERRSGQEQDRVTYSSAYQDVQLIIVDAVLATVDEVAGVVV